MVTNTTAPDAPEEELAPDSERGVESRVFRRCWSGKSTEREAALHVRAIKLSAYALQRLEGIAGLDGVFESTGAFSPRLLPRIALMRGKHNAIRHLASTLSRYAHLQAPEAMVSVTLALLREALSVHETQIVEIVQEALLSDLGGEG